MSTNAVACHRALAVVVCVVLPASSWIEGSRLLAYGMYSSSETYRLEIVAHDAAGRPHWVAPTELSEGATQHASVLLSGADHFRHASGIALLRARLDRLVNLSCTVARPAATSVDLTLYTRDRLDAALVTTRVSSPCPR